MNTRTRVAAMAACAGLALSAAVRAQVSIVNTVSGSFTDISGAGSPVVTGDDASAPVTVSAAASNVAFPAGTIRVCTNGHAGYGGADAEYFNEGTPGLPFPWAAYTYPVAAVYFDDLITQQPGAGVYAQEVTENGHQVLVVEWVRMDHYFTSPSNVNFELKIFGGATGPMGSYAQYLYQSMIFGNGLDNGASATVGYQYSATAAEPYSYDTAGSIPDNSVLTLRPGTTGACCLGNGTCQLLSSNNCASQSGVYHGDNSTCAAANCPSGACCLPNGTCAISASAGCSAQNGVYRGDGTSCATANCPSGACCLPDGTCTVSASAGCSAQNGVYGGDGSSCSNSCPQGACCTSTGCFQYTQAQCTAQAGVFHGAGSGCDASCPTGACCTATGCSVFTEMQCTAQSGVFHGAGSTCAASCPVGACCSSEGCSLMNQVGCTALGGVYHGDGSTCAQAGCPENLVCSGGFESGAFAPCWTQFGNMGFTAVNSGVWINTSPHGGTYEAHFGPVGSTGGITQTINVPAGTMITIDFWYAIDALTPNFFSADLGSTNLISFTDDTSHPTWTEFRMTLAAPSDNPVLTFTTRHDPQYVYLDDIFVSGGSTTVTCYPNCDHSTTIPFLNVNDFLCFQTKFAAGDSYANCDNSTTPPILNVNDFLCFQFRFAAGCSAP